MIDLKPYFDSAQKADEEVQKIMTDMDSAFNEGTDEGKLKALEMKPKLDEAKKKALDANALYLSMRDGAAANSDAAKEFIPASGNQVLPDAAAGKQLDRKEFAALDAAARMKFIQDGGIVVDPE
jgi:hypothetical protein